VSPGFSRDADAAALARGSLFFIDNYALPLMEALAKIMRPDAPVVESMTRNRAEVARAAGLPQLQKSRWPTTSIVEPCQVQRIAPPPQGAPPFTARLDDWAFDAFEWVATLGSQMSLFEQAALRIATAWGIIAPVPGGSGSVANADAPAEPAPGGAIDRAAFTNFVRKLGPMYRDLPYHNMTQAVDRAQALFTLMSLTQPPLLPRLDVIERTALLVSALASDVGHPGRNNEFLNVIRDPVAIRYNALNVLENFHVSTLFSLLRENSCDFTLTFSETQLARFHGLCCTFIMSTDLAKHTFQIEDFDKRLTTASLLPYSRENDRREVLALFLHAADISNPARPPIVAAKWSRAIQQEFELQSEDEARRGLPVTIAKDRDRTRAQVAFMDRFTVPLLHAISRMLGDNRVALDTAMTNRAVLAAQGGLL
jgi:hypothetical protein